MISFLKIFGDSHAKYFFGFIKNADICWLGPVTMHRAGRDQAWFLRSLETSSDQVGVCVFGEIDVRCHIEKQATTKRVSLENIVEELAARYVKSIRENSPFSINVVVGCPPPADGPGLENRDFPVFGTIEKRVVITRLLNTKLRELCNTYNLLFLSVPSLYQTAKGQLDERFSDGSVHIHPDLAWPMVRELETLIGTTLVFDPRPKPRKESLADQIRYFIKEKAWRR